MWKNVFELMALEMIKELALIKVQPSELRGRAREVLVNRFLEPLLPDHVGLGSGVITSVEGENTGQIDIIIYDKTAYSIFKPFTYYMPRESRPFPTEVVYIVIQVENKLTSSRFEKCISRIEEAKKLPKKAYYKKLDKKVLNLYGKQWDYCPTLGIVFSFDSSKMEDLLSLWKETNEERGLNLEHQVDFVCVLKKGLLFYESPQSARRRPQIQFPPNSGCQLKGGESEPKFNLTTFYELIMLALTQVWTRPIKILRYFDSE